MKTINILAISGSLRPNSSNNAIINVMAGMAPGNVIITTYQSLATLPHFNPDLDNDMPPTSVTAFRTQLKNADAVLICTPEYAFGVPGSLKNALDWTVSSSDFVDKPVALITASSQGGHAHTSLLLTLGAISAKIDDNAKLLISFIRSKVNSAGQITDPELLKELQKVLAALISSV
ncbi:NAD(P)H-dependent oxidoreductase [Mucilaginibacter sp. HMF5004]|uniref:NADPH-dependent FMN reductase n=1 Tax=Mucilaginibacter rivuli TaxID=2857527 RepID=UPI001C5CE072|nr:NADPH-dependent FMN reductase [Mucilaginibacter rivuli]MBW4888204.1 NAD(P)H-dependent oxidoreductase [Mucilaginibacter rivuli]